MLSEQPQPQRMQQTMPEDGGGWHQINAGPHLHIMLVGSALAFSAISPMSLQASRKTPISVPLLSSHRSKTGGAKAMNLQSRSRASVGSVLAIVSTVARR